MDMENFLSSAFAYAETSQRTYRNVIPRILGNVQNPASLTAAELVNLIKNSGWGNARQCVALAACKKYLAWKFGQSHPALSAKIKRNSGKAQRAITKEEADIILASFDTTTATGSRNLAIAALALDTGLRLSELCRVQQADTDTERRLLQVIVKGGQWELAVFSQQTALYIEHWKKYRATLSPKGHLFVNTFTGKGLTPGGLQSIIKTWEKRTGLNFSAHAFRRGFATIATENGATERDLMLGGRWKSSQMIARYTRTLKLENMRKYLPLGSNSDLP